MSDAAGLKAKVILLGLVEPYPQEVLGEVCDGAVRSGARFVQYANGDYATIVETPVAIIPHDPDFVEDVIDRDGKPMTSVTARTFSRFAGVRAPFTRLITKLPADYLVHGLVPDQASQLPHRVVSAPIGIHVNHIPKVRSIVDDAFIEIPPTAYNPEEELVLQKDDQRILLAYFDEALRPPRDIDLVLGKVVLYLSTLITGGFGTVFYEDLHKYGVANSETANSALGLVMSVLIAALSHLDERGLTTRATSFSTTERPC